jgi:putative ABC transport system permease protein
MQKMSYPAFIAASIRNKPGRNIATLFCFAFIAANIFSGQFLMGGAAGGVDRGITRMGADRMVVPAHYLVFLGGTGPDNTVALVLAEPSGYRMKNEIMNRLAVVPNISAMSPQLYVASISLPALSPKPVHIYGIDPVSDFTVQPWLETPLAAPLEPGEAIVGSGISVERGSEITIGDQRYRIAGRLDPTGSSADQAFILGIDDAYALAATGGIVPAGAPKIAAGDVNVVMIRDAPQAQLDIVGIQIRRLFASSPEYKYISVIARHVSLDPMAEDIRALPMLLNLISVFVVLISLPLIALIAAMVAHERQREIGLLKSMGAKRNTVFSLVIVESLVLATAGGILGAGLSLVALVLMNAQGVLNSALQVSFRMPSLPEIGSMAGLALFVVITIGSVSALWPAYRSSTMNPYDAIRRDGR